MSAAAVIPSLLPLFIAIAMRRAEASIYRQLANVGAVTAESAIQLSPCRSIERRRLHSLIRGGAVRVTTNSLHFLDARGWIRYRRNRRRRALLAISVVVALLGIVVFVLSLIR
jgi:hypothetical protein